MKLYSLIVHVTNFPENESKYEGNMNQNKKEEGAFFSIWVENLEDAEEGTAKVRQIRESSERVQRKIK